MTFYALHEGFYEGVQTRIDLLKQACEKLGVEFKCLDAFSVDYTELPTLNKKDSLYKFARGAQTLESLLLNQEVTTFYIKNPETHFLHSSTEWSIIHDKANLDSPRTIYQITNDRALLQRYIEHLGGLPIIIKCTGGSRGIGTIKIESWQNLISTVDYLMSTTDTFVMREYISADYGARVMVLSNEVILTKKFYFQENDFRNAPILSQTRYEPMEIDDETKAMCIKAVHLANLEMAGVDLLFEKKTGKAYLMEINCPTGFQSFADDPMPTLTKMIQYLIDKSKRNA